jgi:hypothetical protein
VFALHWLLGLRWLLQISELESAAKQVRGEVHSSSEITDRIISIERGELSRAVEQSLTKPLLSFEDFSAKLHSILRPPVPEAPVRPREEPPPEPVLPDPAPFEVEDDSDDALLRAMRALTHQLAAGEMDPPPPGVINPPTSPPRDSMQRLESTARSLAAASLPPSSLSSNQPRASAARLWPSSSSIAEMVDAPSDIDSNPFMSLSQRAPPSVIPPRRAPPKPPVPNNAFLAVL